MVSSSAELSLIFNALLLLAPTITIVRGGSMDWSKNIINYLCPYTDFCLTKALKVFKYPARNHVPCCSDCSCTNDCIETNSCCPDKTMVSHNSTGPDKTMVSHNSTGFVCKNTMVKKRGGLKDDGNHDGYADGIKRYLITDNCPASEQDKIIQHKCLGADKTTLDDYVWVSDAATGRIYQNYHCAQCHGIKTWKNWNIRTLCSRITDDSFQNLTETLFSEECNIINEVSEELAREAEEYRCYKPTITVCNQTGQWQLYDAAVDEACKRNTVPFFQIDEKLLKMVIYNNLFCYVCNTDAIDNADMVCPSIKGDNRISPTSFSALIDFMEGQEDTKMAASACEINQIYDKYAVRINILYLKNIYTTTLEHGILNCGVLYYFTASSLF